MNTTIRKGLACAAFLLFAGAAMAQDRDRDNQDRDRYNQDRDRRDRDYDWYHQDRDERYREGDRWRQRLFWHVREDLEHVQTATFPVGRDQFRIQRTKQELNEMQDKLARGIYDERELNDVIGALSRVVADNRLSPRDRDVLNDDLRRLREYREHHENWGR
jgi:outer membrane biogenesis lipoprotein LolB